MKLCPICGASAQDIHFGSKEPICRACSAFFRRFVLSPKSNIKCKNEGKCKISFENSKNCRLCRMEKCLKIGMRKTAVQGPRDKHTNSPSTSTSTSSNFSPISEFSEILPRLSLLHNNYKELEKTRLQIFGTPDKPRHRNIHEMDDVIREDVKLVKKFILESYQELGSEFSKSEIDSLFDNFFIRYVNFESPVRGVLAGITELILPNGDFYEKDVERYYTGKIKKSSKVSKESMISFFQQYWETYNRTVVRDVQILKLDVIEFLAVASLMFWDTGLDDFSQKGVETCQKMRDEILSEIIIYYKEFKKLTDHSIRIAQVTLLLISIEKSFSACQEELEMFGFYEDYRQMNADDHQTMNESLKYSWTTARLKARRLAAFGPETNSF